MVSKKVSLMSWNNICIEGLCFGNSKDDKYPCGQKYPTVFCLEKGHCPHFAYSESSERDAAYFVPLRLILWDRFKSAIEGLSTSLNWFFWGQLWFNQKKIQKFLDNIGTATRENCPGVAKWEDSREKADKDFVSWLERTKTP
jgi:hypothetical protein